VYELEDGWMITKMRFYDFPEKILQQHGNFTKTDPQSIKVKIPKKFLTEPQNIFFQNSFSQDVIFLNRTLLTKKINFKKSEEEEERKYEALCDHDELNNYDFSDI